MIDITRAIPTIPCTDLDRAVDFYGNTLGLRRRDVDDPAGGVYFKTGKDSELYVYPRPESHAEHTLAAFEVKDVEATVESLRKKGVTFEDLDLPEMKIKTVNGIATLGDFKAAWFKDPDGNTLAVESKK